MSATSRSQPHEAESTGSLFQFRERPGQGTVRRAASICRHFRMQPRACSTCCSDDSITGERIARVVSSDAGLAARILTMANSTLLHRGGARGHRSEGRRHPHRSRQHPHRGAGVCDRAGAPRRRTGATSAPSSTTCWQEGVRVAALAHAMAKESRLMRPDEAHAGRPAAQHRQDLHPCAHTQGRRPTAHRR